MLNFMDCSLWLFLLNVYRSYVLFSWFPYTSSVIEGCNTLFPFYEWCMFWQVFSVFVHGYCILLLCGDLHFVLYVVWHCGVVLWSRCLFSGRRLSCFLILCYWVRVFLVIVYMSFSYWLCLLKVVNVQCLYSVFLCPWRTACPLCFRGFIPCIRFVSRHIVKMTTVKLGFFFVFVADNNLWISRTLVQKLLQ